jgi:hypothetical protein
MLLVSFFLLAAPNLLPQQDLTEVIPGVRPGAWKVVGPFAPNSSRAPRTTAAAMKAGQPWATLQQTFETTKRQQLSWSSPDIDALLALSDRHQANPRPRLLLDSGALDLRAILASQGTSTAAASNSVMYLYRPIYASEAATMVVSYGVIGSSSLWWNGKAMGSSVGSQRLLPASSEIILNVLPGLNHLLIEVQDVYPDWVFEMRSKRRIESLRINRAIELGVDYLLDTQLIDGSWPPFHSYVNGTTALAVYTLVKSGVSPRSEAVLKGLSFLRQQRAQGTYSVALELMAFQAGGDPQDAELIASIAKRLIAGQATNGMWSYGLSGGPDSGDLSNTQYAALGLRAAAAAGIQVPDETWASLARAVLSCKQSGSGKPTSGSAAGFGYSVGGDGVTMSMTAAGIGTLAICVAHLSDNRHHNAIVEATRAIDRGCEWLGAKWSLAEGITSMHHYYALYGLERAGGLTNREVFGKHAWYDEGAEHIVGDQLENGRWQDDPAPIVECFALLFLRRATSRLALTSVDFNNEHLLQSTRADGPLILRLSLNYPHSLWIDGSSENFDSMERVVYWLQPPDGPWQRMDEALEKRFAIQPNLDIPGEWKVRADAKLSDGRLLTSGTIEFLQREGISADRLAYVNEGHSNLAPSGRPENTASTCALRYPQNALTDGDYSTSWRCLAKDENPQIEIAFRSARKASALKLVLAPREIAAGKEAPQPTRVEVTINNQTPVILRIPNYRHEKAVLLFDKTTAVKKIRLRVISLDHGRLGRASIGFAEVELY